MTRHCVSCHRHLNTVGTYPFSVRPHSYIYITIKNTSVENVGVQEFCLSTDISKYLFTRTINKNNILKGGLSSACLSLCILWRSVCCRELQVTICQLNWLFLSLTYRSTEVLLSAYIEIMILGE